MEDRGSLTFNDVPGNLPEHSREPIAGVTRATALHGTSLSGFMPKLTMPSKSAGRQNDYNSEL
jgi:hypothetical protein